MDQIEELRTRFQEELKRVQASRDVEELKVKFLGRKGPVQALVQLLGEVPQHERKELGKNINLLKEELSKLCEQALKALSETEILKQLSKECIDVTLPGRKRNIGRLHPITQMMQEIIDILVGMGFSVQTGPDIDSDYYNYEGLNFPPDHPAREMQDTFYINPHNLLRSHTSNVQLRVMETHTPPIRVIVPGTVYRNETISSRSHVYFHQVEGIYIDEGVSFADLLSTMREFWQKLFHSEVSVRFRPSFFPFVEPGMEIDIACTACSGNGCRLCKFSGWLEVGGAGMVHPNVLRNGGIDSEHYSGYAWGLGLERMAMLRYGVKDVRAFSENDMRLLAQFG